MAARDPVSVALVEPLRVLIVDDRDVDRLVVKRAFEETGLNIVFGLAESYEDAIFALFNDYFDVVVIDLVLHDGPPGPMEEWEGFDIISEIFERGFQRDMAVFINTAFADMKGVARHAISKFHPADIWDKSFSIAQIRQSIVQALERVRYFGLTIDVKLEDGLDWQILVTKLRLHLHALSSYLDMDPAVVELQHILRRLFAEDSASAISISSIQIAEMDRGASQSAVLRVTPHDGAKQCADVVVKYGPLENIRREYSGWNSVFQFVSGRKLTNVRRVTLGRHLAALEYTLVGAIVTDIVSFSKFYALSSVKDLAKVFDQLFLETCALWYKNMVVVETIDYQKEFEDYIGLNRGALERQYDVKYADKPLTERYIEFANLPRKMVNPVALYSAGEVPPGGRAGICLTHGDLHGENIRVTLNSGDSWLIDFGRSGNGHWARDFVELETAMKFQLMQSADLPSLFEFEDILASADSLTAILPFNHDDRPDLQKAFRAIIHLRSLASKVSPKLTSEEAFSSYLMALFFQTINYIRLSRLIKGGQRKNHVLVSAALILERLLALEERAKRVP
jgi:CheY-like chemotaxis protein